MGELRIKIKSQKWHFEKLINRQIWKYQAHLNPGQSSPIPQALIRQGKLCSPNFLKDCLKVMGKKPTTMFPNF